MNIPLLLSLRGYKKKYIKNDLLAGLAVTAIAVPEVMGIAAMAGLPVQMGLYSAILAPIIFAIFSVSRRLIVGADSATAVLLATGAGALATAGSEEYIQIVATIGLMSAVILMLIRIFKLTFLADLISRPVMIGFLAGIGVQFIITRLPEMIGATTTTGKPLQVLMELPSYLGSFNGMSLTIAVLVVGAILIFNGSRIPGALVGIVGAGLTAYLFQIESKGVAMVGDIPGGLPGLTLPILAPDVLLGLVPVAFSVAIVILAQSASVIRNHADEHDEKTNVPRDIMALSLAGAASSLNGGMAINGSPPRTLAADMAGMRSQLAGVVMSVLVILLLIGGGFVFNYLPLPALAAVVFMIGFHLIRFRELKYLAEHHKMEFAIAMLALVGVILFGVFNGILIAVVASLMERLRREYRPSEDVLLKDGKLSDWAAERVVGIKEIPDDVLVFAFDASLFFENTQYFTHRLRRAIRTAKNPLRAVIIDASAMDDIDYTAVEQLKILYRHLSADGIRLGFSHVSPNLKDQFEDYGVIDLVGKGNIFATLRSAIEYRPPKHDSIIDRVKHLELPKDEYVVVGGAVMEVFNLRDSNDIDVVVSNNLYATYADKPEWHAYPLATGKMVLTKDGINLMRSWMGNTLGMIKRRDTFEKDAVTFMGAKQLIASKVKLGRRKDQSDIALLRALQSRNKRA